MVLDQNYPNPFNPTTTIEFYIPQTDYVTIKIFDIVGREIATLMNRELVTGHQTITWNGKNVSSGIYFIKLESGELVQTKKMVLLK